MTIEVNDDPMTDSRGDRCVMRVCVPTWGLLELLSCYHDGYFMLRLNREKYVMANTDATAVEIATRLGGGRPPKRALVAIDMLRAAANLAGYDLDAFPF